MGNIYFLDRALLDTGWASRVLLETDEHGDISRLQPGTREIPPVAQHLHGVTLAGMPNLHSHAFQRALAGRAEKFSGEQDNFWSWRQEMYQLVSRLQPEHLEAIAAQLYLEMLKAGYTAVAEFHYLHHDHNGKAFNDVSTMSRQILQAAASTGIGLTLLPVLYMSSGFDGAAPESPQSRFSFHRAAEYLDLVSGLQRESKQLPQVEIGLAPHSLRAVPLPILREVCGEFSLSSPDAPIHIHIAEQQREVEDCLHHCGRRPVQLLCEQLPVDQRWCLVHATHLAADELATLAATRAVAGLCPTTEANLGDGLFPLREWQLDAGLLGIGSDSNSSVSPIEELRWLEYGQRLQRLQRNIFAGKLHPNVGANLWREACRGGAQALGRKHGGLKVGARADMVTLDTEHPLLIGREEDTLIDSLIFSGNSSLFCQVISGGQWLIRDGHHAREEEIGARFKQAIKELG